MPGPTRPAPVPVRVLVLRSSTARPQPDWAGDAVDVTTVVLDGEAPSRLNPGARLRRGLRRATLTVGLPLTRRVNPGAVWRYLHLDGPLAPTLNADVVLSAEPRLDRHVVLAARISGAEGVLHDTAREAAERLVAFRALLQRVTAHVMRTAARQPPDAALVGRLREAAAALLDTCPAPLVPVDHVAAQARSWVGRLPHQVTAQLVTDAFAGLPWPEPWTGASGLGARLEWGRLSTDPDPDAELDRVRLAAAHAAEGSRAAAESDRFDLSVGRWSDAWELLYHRELHTDVGSSPLVDAPGDWLAPLLTGPVPEALVRHRPEGPRNTGPRTARQPPSVVVATGLSGNFHEEVAEALSSVADVRTLDVVRTFPRLRRHGRPSVTALRELAATRGLLEDPRQAARVERLRRAVTRRDVVFSDWADASTVWLSYVCPAGVRLVVRVHSVDALDAWFPLVDWVNVDEVVVSPALHSLVVELLEACGITSLPVTVLPPLVGVRELGPEKDDGARCTLGMVGWARRVKDVAWALDLLDQDPRWRLVLIGHQLTEPRGSARSRRYHSQVLERLRRPDVASRVEVAGWSDDVAVPLRRVGVILSTSRRESLHHGLVEGVASGAVPVVRNWPIYAARGGARTVYPDDWVVETVQEAATRIHATTADDATWERARLEARQQALSLFDPDRAAELYRTTVLGVRRPTRETPGNDPGPTPAGGGLSR